MSPSLPSSFAFRTVPQLICSAGASQQLGERLREHFPQASRALFVTDAAFLRTGLLDAPIASLMTAGFRHQVFSGVVADPTEAIVAEAVARAEADGIDLVIGFGGGSSMDVAKLVAVLAGGSQSLADMYGIDRVARRGLPLVQVPTTAGTGSEVTPIAIVTTGETTKAGIVSPHLYADLAILDAALTVGLPPAVTAATGIDAMVHAIEAYTSRHKKNPLSDMLARQALTLLAANLQKVCENGADIAARQAMLLGAMLAGQAFANAPVAAVHALAYPIGGIFHVPHGLSNALVLPHVLRFNLPAAAAHYAELSEILSPGCSGSDEARAATAIEALTRLAARVGIPSSLQAVGIVEGDLDRLADAAMQQTRLLGNNPRDVNREDAHAIYAAALQI
ncbi:MAG: iron-containing alcohol dehydrogenase [Burkholderiaceae bacterium]